MWNPRRSCFNRKSAEQSLTRAAFILLLIVSGPRICIPEKLHGVAFQSFVMGDRRNLPIAVYTKVQKQMLLLKLVGRWKRI
jgi:hypothetical protein